MNMHALFVIRSRLYNTYMYGTVGILGICNVLQLALGGGRFQNFKYFANCIMLIPNTSLSNYRVTTSTVCKAS